MKDDVADCTSSIQVNSALTVSTEKPSHSMLTTPPGLLISQLKDVSLNTMTAFLRG